MKDDKLMYAVYLSALAALFIVRFAGQSSKLQMKNFKLFIVWGTLFLALLLAYSFGSEIKTRLGRELFPSHPTVMGQDLVVKRDISGHFNIMATVNGHPTMFMIDTGATGVLLARDDAAKAGLEPQNLEYIYEAETANGKTFIAKSHANLTIGNTELEDVRVGVSQHDGDSLLGMEVLKRFSTIKVEGDELYLTW
jgi:aspartyl protease family protein